MKTAIIKSSELGTNCWLPVRFCGGRCQHVMTCTYPEKKICKAVQTEIAHLKSEMVAHQQELEGAIKKLSS